MEERSVEEPPSGKRSSSRRAVGGPASLEAASLEAASLEAASLEAASPEAASLEAAPLEEEFARLAQRDLTAKERELALALLGGRDLWASGFDPESLPVLAAALGAAALVDGPARPILFLSPETELLRARQVRFGARARTWLLDGGHAAQGSPQEQGAVDEWTLDGAGGVVWCTLESLGDARTRRALAARSFAAIFVESAHAASPRAFETRPSLALIPALRAACGSPPVVAISRAVPEAIRLDAAARLGLVELEHHRVPLAVPTRLSVVTRATVRADERKLVELVERLPRPTIVFCDTPQETDTVFGQLAAAQVPVHRYHGAMSASERATEMLHFTLPGRRAVMVATSAFRPGSGLAGIDGGETATPEGLGLGYGKQRARSLLHLCAPASLEQYALELSVLGTEEETEAILFVGPSDMRRVAAHLELLRTTPEQVEAVADSLCTAEVPLEPSGVELASGLGRKVVARVLRLLADAGVVEEVRGPEQLTVSSRVPAEALRQVASLLSSGLGQMRDEDARRLDAVAALLSTTECRRAFVEAYLGAEDTTACGQCDACLPAAQRTKGKRVAAARAAEPAAEPAAQRRTPARTWSVTAGAVETLRVAAPVSGKVEAPVSAPVEAPVAKARPSRRATVR